MGKNTNSLKDVRQSRIVRIKRNKWWNSFWFGWWKTGAGRHVVGNKKRYVIRLTKLPDEKDAPARSRVNKSRDGREWVDGLIVISTAENKPERKKKKKIRTSSSSRKSRTKDSSTSKFHIRRRRAFPLLFFLVGLCPLCVVSCVCQGNPVTTTARTRYDRWWSSTRPWNLIWYIRIVNDADKLLKIARYPIQLFAALLLFETFIIFIKRLGFLFFHLFCFYLSAWSTLYIHQDQPRSLDKKGEK